MKRIILFILLFIIILFTTGCSSPQKKLDKNINGILLKNVEKQIEEKSVKIGQLIIFQKLVSYIGIFIFAIFISIIIIFLGARVIGLSILTGSVVCISLILGLSLYTKYVAIIGILCILAGIYFLGKELFNKTIFERDLVSTVEIAKSKISSIDKTSLKKSFENIQSKNTKKIVKKIKNK